MIDQKPRDPLYPQGFEDIDNLKNRQIPRPKPKEKEDNDLKILKSFNQKLGKYIGPKPKNIIENEEKKKNRHDNYNFNYPNFSNIRILFLNL